MFRLKEELVIKQVLKVYLHLLYGIDCPKLKDFLCLHVSEELLTCLPTD